MIRRQVWLTCLVVAASSCAAFAPGTPHQLSFLPRHQVLLMARNNRNFNRVKKAEPKPPMNEEITAPELRVVAASSTGGKDEPLGILARDVALAKAKELGGLDLIMINDKSDPPVCKIVDYSKFRYMKEKKAKELKKNSKATEIKEVKMSYKIDVHDYDVRKKNASKFLRQGNRVKCTIMFRGREVQHDKLGYELLDKLAADLGDLALSEGRAKREGRNLARILSPRPEVVKAVTEGKRAEEKAKKRRKEAAFKEKLAAAAVETQAEEVAVTASAIAELEEERNVDEILSSLTLDDDAGTAEEESVESSLDALLGSDRLTDDLFS